MLCLLWGMQAGEKLIRPLGSAMGQPRAPESMGSRAGVAQGCRVVGMGVIPRLPGGQSGQPGPLLSAPPSSSPTWSCPSLTSGSSSFLLFPGGGRSNLSRASSPLSSPPIGTGLLYSFHLIIKPEAHITSHPPSSERFPQSALALRDGLGRGPGCFPDISSGVGSGWPQ